MAAALLAVAATTIATSIPRTVSGCQSHPATTEGVIATEHAWVRAIETRDTKALSCILAPDFFDTNWRGEVLARDVVLARLPSRPPSHLNLSELSVFRDARFAIVRGTNAQSGPVAVTRPLSVSRTSSSTVAEHGGLSPRKKR